MRNISFSMTIQQYEAGIKDVTRRVRWLWLVKHYAEGGPTIFLGAVEKGQGIPRGEKVRRLTPSVIEVVSARRETLADITAEDVVREGFPGMTTDQFILMYCQHNKCKAYEDVTRIEFRRRPDLEAV